MSEARPVEAAVCVCENRANHTSGLGLLDLPLPVAGGRHERAPELPAEHNNKKRASEQIHSMKRGKLALGTI